MQSKKISNYQINNFVLSIFSTLSKSNKALSSEYLNHHGVKIDLPTEEDRHYGIDRWAKLFKTETYLNALIAPHARVFINLRIPYDTSHDRSIRLLTL